METKRQPLLVGCVLCVLLYRILFLVFLNSRDITLALLSRYLPVVIHIVGDEIAGLPDTVRTFIFTAKENQRFLPPSTIKCVECGQRNAQQK